MNGPLKLVLIFGTIVGGAGWILTAPSTVESDMLATVSADVERGKTVFYASGCASCHATPDSQDDAKLRLGGGHAFKTDFGTFYAPNISSDVTAGIGAWTDEDLANALIHGTSPEKRHYYPAFPYTTYAQMTLEDVASLRSFLSTLPAVATPNTPHDVRFPFNIRRILGGWKLMFTRKGWVLDGDLTEQQIEGRYLVEALGHCAECHTPRNALGGMKRGSWLAGGPNPDGKGTIPDLTPAGLDWSEGDIAEYLKSGFTPEYDTAGGQMVDVIENTSQLSDAERAAIAAYLKALPVQ